MNPAASSEMIDGPTNEPGRGGDGSRRPRIVYVITELNIGGAEMFMTRVSDRLIRDGMPITVISLGADGALVDELARRGIPVVEIGMNSKRLNIRRFIRLCQTLRGLKPDLVQTWLYHADLLGFLAARLAGVPVVVWNIRCSELDLRVEHVSLHIVLRLLAWMSHAPAAVICNSEAGRRSHERLGYRPKRWIMIPNGVDTAALSLPTGDRTAVRGSLGIDAASVVFGLVGRLHPMKGQSIFLEAAAIVASRHPSVHFLLAGRGVDESDELRRRARSVGSGAQVTMLGERADIARLMAALDVAVSASRYGEGFPNVIAEAMGCGVPCLVTDVGDAAAIVGDTGLVTAPGDAAALAEGMERLVITASEERKALGIRARARIEAEYSLGRAANRYRRLYDELTRSFIRDATPAYP